VSNAQLQSNLANYQTTAGLSANVATLTANNSTNFNGQPASFYANAQNLTTGTLPSARVSGSYTGITSVGTLGTLNVTGNTTLNNFSITSNTTQNVVTIGATTNVNIDSGVLFVDAVNNRVGINNTTPDASLTITGSANVSGNLYIGGDFIIAGTLTTTGTTESQGDIIPAASGFNLGNTTHRWDLIGVDVNLTGNVDAVHANLTTAVAVGANVIANTTALKVGNSSAYSIINSNSSEFTGNVSVLGNTTVLNAYANVVIVGHTTINSTVTAANIITTATRIDVGDRKSVV
jgi:hypothetical protein